MSSGKSYSFSAKYFCFNFVISTDVFWKRKKSLLIIFNSFLFIAKTISPSCSKYVQLLFNKKYRKVMIFVFQFRCLKITCIGAALVLPKINVLFFTYLLHSFYFHSQIQGLGSYISIFKNLTWVYSSAITVNLTNCLSSWQVQTNHNCSFSV